MPITLCVLLWPTEGNADLLSEYEDGVLALVPAHGGRVLSRVRALPGQDATLPTEVQVIEMPDDDALAAYLADPARVALAEVRDRAVARTDILGVTAVSDRDTSS
ncbi:hypothetical protein H1Q78_04745 [Cellulosimicrobium cellulans]|uniref:DUF1330 domain-containing protein n=1 Tax=Cellulosimicrobium cellulans TaxID=1710 RepID=UPI001EDC2D82|nr:DUF1330 domain-containing protein [Cellulosimicrobium cellulans]UKJ64711.1 hypothetical protein H1Q78_04745 [Cellulosimicrobium cellulans]